MQTPPILGVGGLHIVIMAMITNVFILKTLF